MARYINLTALSIGETQSRSHTINLPLLSQGQGHDSRFNMAPKFLKFKAQAADAKTSLNTVPDIVNGIIDTVRSKGDAAVREYSEKFDHWSPKSFKLSQDEIKKIIEELPEQTIKDIKEVQHNVRRFAEAQRKAITDFELETQPGVHLGQKNIPIASVAT